MKTKKRNKNYKPPSAFLGERRHRLTCIGYEDSEELYQEKLLVRCDCKDKTEKYVSKNKFSQGAIKSCGCLVTEIIQGVNKEIASGKRESATTTHGMSKTKIYRVWHGMKKRCLDVNNPYYHRYGGRGIKVCDRWLDFSNFYYDMGDAPNGYSLDRIDNDGGYSPENCRWATATQQVYNRRRQNSHYEAATPFKGVALVKNEDSGNFFGRFTTKYGQVYTGYSSSDELLALRYDKSLEDFGYNEGTNKSMGLTNKRLYEYYPCDFWYEVKASPKIPKLIKLIGDIAQ